MPEGSSTYVILNAMSDAFFYFIPVFLAYTAAKRFNTDPFTAMLLACVLVYPDVTQLMKAPGAGGDGVGRGISPEFGKRCGELGCCE